MSLLLLFGGFATQVIPPIITPNPGGVGGPYAPVKPRRARYERIRIKLDEDDLDLLAQRLRASIELNEEIKAAQAGPIDKTALQDGFKALQGLLDLTEAEFVEADSEALARSMASLAAAKQKQEQMKHLAEAERLARKIMEELQDEEDAIIALLLA